MKKKWVAGVAGLVILVIGMTVALSVAVAQQNPPAPPPRPGGGPGSGASPEPLRPPPPIQAIFIKNHIWNLPPQNDIAEGNRGVTGTLGWTMNLISPRTDGLASAPSQITNARITVTSSLPADAFNPSATFPVTVSAPFLANGQQMNLDALRSSTVPASFNPGFDVRRTMVPAEVPPGGSRQTVTVRVIPQAVLYSAPNASLLVGINGTQGNPIVSTKNPSLFGGDEFGQVPSCPCAEVALWSIRKPRLGVEYVFTAELQVGNNSAAAQPFKPVVTALMSAHVAPMERLPASPSVTVSDADLKGSAVFSVGAADREWVRIVEDEAMISLSPQLTNLARPPIEPKILIGSRTQSGVLNSGGVSSVSILTVPKTEATASNTTEYSASDLNPGAIRILDARRYDAANAQGGALGAGSTLEDVNGDGRSDLVLKFTADALKQAGIDSSTTSVVLLSASFKTPLKPVPVVVRDLSAVSLSLKSATPNSAGDTGPVLITIDGQGIQQGATIRLTKAGQQDIKGTIASTLPDGRLSVSFNLAGKSQGGWNIVITNPDGRSTTLASAFTVAKAEPPNLWVDIIGRDTVRVGFEQTMTIMFGNRSNTLVTANLAVWGIPAGWDAKLAFDYDGISLPPNVNNPGLTGPFVVTEKGLGLSVVLVLPPGYSGSLPIVITSKDQTVMDLQAAIAPMNQGGAR